MAAPWDIFAEKKLKQIIDAGGTILDVGGGLRTDPRNDRGVQRKELAEYLKQSKAKYVYLDVVPDYNPDIIGDVHNLPYEDNSLDAVLAIALLEHVEDPLKAMNEMHRVLKPGGYLYLYVPFLFYYHPHPGYCNDYYRYTLDGVKYLTRKFSHTEIQNVRGAMTTWLNFLPFLAKRTNWFDWLDRLTGKTNSNQTSGYIAFSQK
jgi:SAM-dependent methyltransferase